MDFQNRAERTDSPSSAFQLTERQLSKSSPILWHFERKRLGLIEITFSWLRKLASMADGDLLLVTPCGLSDCAECALDVVGT